MKKYYFKSSEQQGEIFLQLRYYSPFMRYKCYEAVIILISPTGQVRQFIDYFNECELKSFQQNLQKSKEIEFNAIQEQKTLGGTGRRNEVYDTYYNQWKDYFLAKKSSLKTVRSSTTSNKWDYYDRLENEWILNGINEKRENLKKLAESVKQQNNISLSDIYKEALNNATLDYVTNRI